MHRIYSVLFFTSYRQNCLTVWWMDVCWVQQLLWPFHHMVRGQQMHFTHLDILILVVSILIVS